MRRIVVAVLAALVGFGLFFFWFGGRAPTPEPVQVTAPETLPTETAPADTAGAVTTPPAEPAADAPVPPTDGREAAEAVTAAPEAEAPAAGETGADGALQNEIRSLVDQAVGGQGAAPVAPAPAPATDQARLAQKRWMRPQASASTVVGGGVADAEVRAEAEGGTEDHRDTLGGEERGGEVLVRGDRACRPGCVRPIRPAIEG